MHDTYTAMIVEMYVKNALKPLFKCRENLERRI